MVIGPKVLIDQIQQDEQEKVERLEQKIDESIRKSFGGQGSCIYHFDADCYALRSFVLEGFLDKYRAQGWSSVKIRSRNDGRQYYDEGTKYIEFKYRADETKTKWKQTEEDKTGRR